MFAPKDDNFCGRSTVAASIREEHAKVFVAKALIASLAGNPKALKKMESLRRRETDQLAKRIAMAVHAVEDSGKENGNSVYVTKLIHECGPRAPSAVSPVASAISGKMYDGQFFKATDKDAAPSTAYRQAFVTKAMPPQSINGVDPRGGAQPPRQAAPSDRAALITPAHSASLHDMAAGPTQKADASIESIKAIHQAGGTNMWGQPHG